jgi:hypothetical protein
MRKWFIVILNLFQQTPEDMSRRFCRRISSKMRMSFRRVKIGAGLELS